METIEQIGHWVMIRHYRTRHSGYYNKVYDEGVGGNKYQYDDYLVKAYSTAISFTKIRQTGETSSEFGNLNLNFKEYIFNNNVIAIKDRCVVKSVLDTQDEIYELEYYKKEPPTIVYKLEDEDLEQNKVCPKEKYKVKQLIRYSADSGLPQLIKVLGDKTIVYA